MEVPFLVWTICYFYLGPIYISLLVFGRLVLLSVLHITTPLYAMSRYDMSILLGSDLSLSTLFVSDRVLPPIATHIIVCRFLYHALAPHSTPLCPLFVSLCPCPCLRLDLSVLLTDSYFLYISVLSSRCRWLLRHTRGFLFCISLCYHF